MEVKIGVVHSGRELSIDIEGGPEDVAKIFADAIADGGRVVWLTDGKGRRLGVPIDKLAYVEIDQDEGTRRVGFGV